MDLRITMEGNFKDNNKLQEDPQGKLGLISQLSGFEVELIV